MADTHSEARAYVARHAIEPQAPPPNQKGAALWVRENLFSTWFNTALTLASVFFLYLILPDLWTWAVSHSVWYASSLSECREIITTTHGDGASGACWAVIRERFGQMIYGFYPAPLRWRPNLTLLFLAVALAPVLFETMRPLVWAMLGLIAAQIVLTVFGELSGFNIFLFGRVTVVAAVVAALAWVFDGPQYRKYWLWGLAAYPFVAVFLMLGGGPLTPVATDRFGGMLLTLVIGVTGIAASLPLGVLLALGRRSSLPILNIICVTFIEFIRGVPLITLLFVASTLLNYFLPPGTNFDIVLRVIIMVTLFASAYMAEVIRGGLAALARGQYEAADALGLGYWQSMRLIILPQALKIAIPGIVNTFIGLFKDTTLVSIIALFDPLGLTKPILADSAWQGLVWELYAFIAMMFFVCCWGMSRYSIYLEQRLRAGEAQ